MFGEFIPYVNKIMDYSTVNRKVIANNIANFNTPGYKTQTLKFDRILNDEAKTPLLTTNEKHINNSYPTLSVPDYSVATSSSGSSRIDGNNVNQTTEMINMLKNNSLYTKSVNALNKEYSFIRTAIGR